MTLQVVENIEVFGTELLLLSWRQTNTGGATATFQIDDDLLEYLQGKTAGAKGGQRFAVQLVELASDDSPRQDMGPLCRWAVQRCEEEQFQLWLAKEFPTTWKNVSTLHPQGGPAVAAREVICHLCGIKSRRELDSNQHAQVLFHSQIRAPYARDLQLNAPEKI